MSGTSFFGPVSHLRDGGGFKTVRVSNLPVEWQSGDIRTNEVSSTPNLTLAHLTVASRPQPMIYLTQGYILLLLPQQMLPFSSTTV